MGPAGTSDDRGRDPRARLVVAAACVAIFAIAVLRDGYTVESVDVRTYMEMTRGIALHGLPYLDNGPVERFGGILLVPWNVLSHGHMWGVYGPVYPYFAAPFMALGGVRLVTAATCSLIAPVALVTFLLARRLLDGAERMAALAAAVVAFSTPLLAKALETTAYPLAALFTVSATYAALLAATSRGKRRIGLAALTGLLASLGSATHLLCMPMGVALVGALAITDAADPDTRRGPAWLDKTPLRGLWPFAEGIRSAAVAFASMVVVQIPVALLNHVRFGTYNPFTYGPTPWAGSADNGVADQTIGGHIRYGMPVLALVGAVVVALVVVNVVAQRKWLWRVVVLAAAVVAVAASHTLQDRGLRYAMIACGFIADQSILPLGAGYKRPEGGFGYLYGPWVIKSTLQCTPLLLLVFALPKLEMRTRQMAFVVLAPCAALYAYLMLRANLPLHSGLGFPWVYIRYTMPALPMLVAASMLVVREVSFGKAELAVMAISGAVLTTILTMCGRDVPIFRQIVVLVGPLVFALAALVMVSLWRRGLASRRVAALSVALVCGVGFGIGLGHDLRANILGKAWINSRYQAFARITPEKFAVFGYLGPMENALGTRASRDVQYGDLFQVNSWERVRPVLDYWFDEGRPVFFVTDDAQITSPWPDVAFEYVDREQRYYKVIRNKPLAKP